jgi:hypothetical protein
MLSAALGLARSAKDDSVLGEVLCAYGVFLQHEGDPAGARPLLEEVLNVLSASNPTALVARTHLKAINESRPCDCGHDLPDALGDSVKALLRGRVPSDLIADLAVEAVPNDKPRVHVQLARAPSEDEKRLLDQAIKHAVLQIQNEIRGKGWVEKSQPIH